MFVSYVKDMGDKGRIGWMQILATAFLTCVLTVVSGIAVWYFTRQDAILKYSLIKTEPFLGASAMTSIYRLEVVNSGSKEVDAVTAYVNFPNEKIEDRRLTAPSGMQVDERPSDRRYSLRLPVLNPRERVQVSFLVTSTSAPVAPEVNVRGQGVTASPIDAETSWAGRDSPLFAAIPAAAGILAGLASLLATAILRSGGRGLGGSAHLRSPKHTLASACFVHGLVPEGKRLLSQGEDVKFWAESDRLIAEQMGSDDKQKSGLVAKVLAYVLEYDPELSETTKNILNLNIGRLRVHAGDEEKGIQHIREAINSGDQFVLKRLAVSDDVKHLIRSNREAADLAALPSVQKALS